LPGDIYLMVLQINELGCFCRERCVHPRAATLEWPGSAKCAGLSRGNFTVVAKEARAGGTAGGHNARQGRNDVATVEILLPADNSINELQTIG
jgi:hypothetical protein